MLMVTIEHVHVVVKSLDMSNVRIMPSLNLFKPMMGAIYAPEKSILTRVTRRHIPEEGILHSHLGVNL
jgi:hypothetical protein